jgi:protein-tyrosine phosphatase
MKHAVVFGLFGTLLAVWGVWLGGLGLLLLWPAGSFLLIGSAYARLGPRVCGKRPDGRIAWWAFLFLLPYLLMTWTGWYIIRLLSRETCCDEVAPGVWVGRRPFVRDLPANISLIVDLTAEFPAPRSLRRGRTYLCVPTLDATAPEEIALRVVVEQAAVWSGAVYIHCALGHARSAMTAAAVLIRRGHAEDAEQAVTAMRKARPGIRLEKSQRRLLERMALSAMRPAVEAVL